MSAPSVKQLTSKIADFVSQKGSCLFAGAGVGIRAGLPSWENYLEHLCSIAGRYDKDIENLMRKRLKAGYYLEAAELYKTAIEIPDGVKYSELCVPFVASENYNPNKLHALMALPFSAVVTTNYDRSLLDAYHSLFDRMEESGLKLKAPKYVELGDLSMKHAIYWTDFYIARIHGRAEIPESIVLDSGDYLRTEKDPHYQDFVLHVLKTYHCLFIGYSFLDPAIGRILDLMRKTLPSPYAKLHLAILPNNCEGKLQFELRRYNIEIIEYDPKDGHEEVWESIREAQHKIRTSPREPPDRIESVKGLRRFVATCYSRLRLGNKAEPLREIVIEGIVAQAIIDAGPQGITQVDLIQYLKRYLSLTDEQLGNSISRSLERLTLRKICSSEGDILRCHESNEKLDTALETLVDSVVSRLKVREGVEAVQAQRYSIAEVLNRVLLSRGWDLGAHFAGGNPSGTFDAWPQIKEAIENLVRNITPMRSTALANAIFDLLRHPEDREAELLADIGRVAFAVELIMNNARDTLELNFIPEIVYLDANVLMPAIVDGHPYSPVYADAVERVVKAAETGGASVRLITAKGFLNEVINHRNLAIQEVREQGLEKADKLHNRILFYGAENSNVYIGAYASFVGRSGEEVSFEEFLKKAAPYGSEKELEEYLGERGIETSEFSFLSGEEKALYEKIRSALHRAYDDLADQSPHLIKKARVLVDHESSQLSRLFLDMNSRKKVLFVTADKRLMGLCSGPLLGHCANAILSHVGFIQLVDLILGIDTDKRSLARLFWSIDLPDDKIVIRNYLIDLALRHYDEARAMAMWEVVDEIAEKAAVTARLEKIVVFPGKEENRARSAKFLDRFEQDFFKNMAEVIRKREKRNAQ